ncbi:fumarylacetoacetate hydrolase family protein [Phreatobacter stygius]|uniref:Fumarylacetoacetate hydrolase family protein n=1 Tax=Phreatobacter stygius TaxID=1940610 RepID=A0A4D7B8T8_9HYPH|nr:fumarylacetoacetate hydrolase family protein [Phreatobacter stygius]QCI66850.1 fumarylacetoacetate hydrolase family protein [Phreatobacter stygius]
MKLASFRLGGAEHFGAVVGSGLVDLGGRLRQFTTLRDAIAADATALLRDTAERASPDHALADVELTIPITTPEKIWCIGVNYADRNAEYKDNSAPQSYPSLFCRTPSSFVGHGVPLERPKVSSQLDYEGEIVMVIGKGGRHIPRESALGHIFGLTLCNEGSVRDWLHHAKFNVTQGKNFDRSGAIGPWIVTSDALDPAQPLELTTRVNGEVRQHDSTRRLMFPFDYLIAYLSTFATLKPGDMIVTGTPTGAGVRFDPPKWLIPGDIVEVEVPGIGTLRNGVTDEA